VVILHGVQIDKWAANGPVNIVDLSPENVAFIAQSGFNLVRLSMTFSGVEPEPGSFDQSYVDSFLAFDGELARHGIYDLLDMMQGEYSQLVGGWGFPNWMTIIGSTPNTQTPFPNGYEVNPAQYVAWDSFWSNATTADGIAVQADYISGLERIAASFASAPALLGIEIFNEPWPGSQWPSCANPIGCPLFDQLVLTPFYRKAVRAIRSADPSHPIAYEPNIFFDYGANSQLGAIGDSNGLFAFHNYCLDAVVAGAEGLPNGQTFSDPLQLCGVGENLVFANALARASSSGDAILMDEWGNTNDTTVITRITAAADKYMVGWSYWAYEDCCGSLGAIVKDGTEPPTALGNLNTPVLDALVRPYPQVIAGTPIGWSYDPDERRFVFRYSTRPVGGENFPPGTVTTIEVPQRHYPDGYRASVSGARIVSAPGADHLELEASDGARTVSVVVTPQ